MCSAGRPPNCSVLAAHLPRGRRLLPILHPRHLSHSLASYRTCCDCRWCSWWPDRWLHQCPTGSSSHCQSQSLMSGLRSGPLIQLHRTASNMTFNFLDTLHIYWPCTGRWSCCLCWHDLPRSYGVSSGCWHRRSCSGRKSHFIIVYPFPSWSWASPSRLASSKASTRTSICHCTLLARSILSCSAPHSACALACGWLFYGRH